MASTQGSQDKPKAIVFLIHIKNSQECAAIALLCQKLEAKMQQTFSQFLPILESTHLPRATCLQPIPSENLRLGHDKSTSMISINRSLMIGTRADQTSCNKKLNSKPPNNFHSKHHGFFVDCFLRKKKQQRKIKIKENTTTITPVSPQRSVADAGAAKIGISTLAATIGCLDPAKRVAWP